MSEKLMWYIRRIQSMSTAEIIHRFHEAEKRKFDRICGSRLIPDAAPFSALPHIPGLRDNLEQWDVPASLLAEWEEETTRLRSGAFFLLGQQWPECSSAKRWHLDPITGKNWPTEQYCFKVNYRHNTGMGDVKLVWELNRLQHIQPVAALAFKRRDENLARECLTEIESWIDSNPPFNGVNWCSGIELALRAVSIIFVLSLVGEYATQEQSAKIRLVLEVHGRWIARYISAYSSANNHRTAEGLGLFIIGSTCQEFPLAEKWKKLGWQLLTETARLQILSDGTGAEQTVSYTAVVLEMLLLGLHIAKSNRTPVPSEYLNKIVLGGEYLRWFMDEGGELPHIGDNDNARVIGVYSLNETYIRSVLGCVASSTERDDLIPPGLTPHLRQAIFVHASGDAVGPLGVRIFPAGGYTVGRHLLNGRKILAAIDHGDLGYLSIAAHGHADALSVWLHIDDQPVLIDSGTYLYHSGGAWRSYFRSTAAHNTLCIEGESSSIISGSFNWSRKASARAVSFEETPDGWCVDTKHDGYMFRFGAMHYRTFTFGKGGLKISDRISGIQPRSVEISYLLHPELIVRQESDTILVDRKDEKLLKISSNSILSMQVFQTTDQGCGWFSPTFGIKMPAPRIVLSGKLSPNQIVETMISL